MDGQTGAIGCREHCVMHLTHSLPEPKPVLLSDSAPVIKLLRSQIARTNSTMNHGQSHNKCLHIGGDYDP